MKELLTKYMHRVIDCEGTSFVPPVWSEYSEFTKDEWKTLKGIEGLYERT